MRFSRTRLSDVLHRKACALCPARCCRHFVQPVFFIQCPVRKLDVSCLPVSDLVPLAQMRYQSLLHMVPYLTQRFAAIAIVKVANPASHGGVDLIHDPIKRHDRPLSLREIGDPVFDGLQGFLRWLNMRIIVPRLPAFPHPDRKSEKVKLPFKGIDDFGLCLIQGEPQPLQVSAAAPPWLCPISFSGKVRRCRRRI